MTVRSSSPPADDDLTDLADQVTEEFEEYRGPEGFKTVSVLIDNSEEDRQTLIVHIDGEDAPSVAEEVEAFLDNQGAHTQRERHSDTDIRVLTTS